MIEEFTVVRCIAQIVNTSNPFNEFIRTDYTSVCHSFFVEPHDDWAPKGKSGIRTVPLSARVESMLRGCLAHADTIDMTARIFPESWTAKDSHVGQQFRRIRERLGMGTPNRMGQKLRVHSFRHYYAPRLVRMGVDCAAVRDLAEEWGFYCREAPFFAERALAESLLTASNEWARLDGNRPAVVACRSAWELSEKVNR